MAISVLPKLVADEEQPMDSRERAARRDRMRELAANFL